LTYINTEFRSEPALTELSKKHPVCTKIGLFEIQNRSFFLGGKRETPFTDIQRGFAKCPWASGPVLRGVQNIL